MPLKLVGASLVLLLMQQAMFAVIDAGIARNTQSTLQRQLDVGDRAKLEDALGNHGGRLQPQLGAVFDPLFEPLAKLAPGQSAGLEDLVAQAPVMARSGWGVVYVQGKPQQVVIVPAQVGRAELGWVAMGFSIDDLGEGQTSMCDLKDLPVHELKIDMVFVKGLQTDLRNESIARALAELGCGEGQGWHFGRSMPAPQPALASPSRCMVARSASKVSRAQRVYCSVSM